MMVNIIQVLVFLIILDFLFEKRVISGLVLWSCAYKVEDEEFAKSRRITFSLLKKSITSAFYIIYIMFYVYSPYRNPLKES